MIQIGNDEHQSRYRSYEEYLRRFYCVTTMSDYFQSHLEASFCKKLAKRVLELEATEKTKEPEETP